MDRVEVTEKNLEDIPIGTFFKFNTYDSEENTDWEFTFCKGSHFYIYLGGGMDGGTAIGKRLCAKDVLKDVNDSDFPCLSICDPPCTPPK